MIVVSYYPEQICLLMLLAGWTWSYVYGTAQLVEECVLRARSKSEERYFSATMILFCSQTSESLSVLLRHCLPASYKAIGPVNKPTFFRVLMGQEGSEHLREG